jgi:Polyketide cyclase / dehydrase and lipid transport
VRRRATYAVLGLVGLIGLVAIIGWLLPKGHVASRSVKLAASPEAVFAAVSDFATYPQWRSDVEQIEVLPDAGDGKTVVREHGSNGVIPYRVEVLEPPSKLVMRIDDPSLAFGGTWTYDVYPSDSGTELVITEDGEVYNPFFRVMARLFFSPYDTIDRYLADLKKRLGERER